MGGEVSSIYLHPRCFHERVRAKKAIIAARRTHWSGLEEVGEVSALQSDSRSDASLGSETSQKACGPSAPCDRRASVCHIRAATTLAISSVAAVATAVAATVSADDGFSSLASVWMGSLPSAVGGNRGESSGKERASLNHAFAK